MSFHLALTLELTAVLSLITLSVNPHKCLYTEFSWCWFHLSCHYPGYPLVHGKEKSLCFVTQAAITPIVPESVTIFYSFEIQIISDVLLTVLWKTCVHVIGSHSHELLEGSFESLRNPPLLCTSVKVIFSLTGNLISRRIIERLKSLITIAFTYFFELSINWQSHKNDNNNES